MLLLGLPILAISQLSITDIISSETYSIDIYSSPNPPDHLSAQHGQLSKIYQGSGIYTLYYTPDPNYLGYDTISYNFWDGPGLYSGSGFMVNVVLSIITTNPDYGTTDEGIDLLINVLDNDSSTDNSLFLSGIPVFNNGVATIVPPNSVYFSPDAGFSGSTSLNYTVCDALGTCATETVIIFVNSDEGTPQYDTLNLQVKKNTILNIPLPYNGYSLDSDPTYGSAAFISSTVIEYDPNTNFIGVDAFTITKNINGVDTYITINVDVLSATAPNSIAFDDYIFTPKNTTKEFNVVANDLFENARIKNFSQPNHGTLTKISNQSFRYVPDSGFSGPDKFRYTLRKSMSNQAWESAWVYIRVSDQEPSQDTYTFETAKNTPKVLYYNSPIEEFSFTVNSSPDHGLVQVLSGMVDTVILGQNIVGNNLILYTPNVDFVGGDEFEVTYCVNSSGNCSNTKIIMNVVDNIMMSTCISDDCVWPGDCNNDGIVNMIDLLQLGIGIGELGANRPSPSTEWTGQESYDWNKSNLGELVDMKYVDTDGDGFVTMLDQDNIDTKYGKTHSLSPEYNAFKKEYPLFFEVHNPQPVYYAGDVITFDLILGKEGSAAAIDMYGFTFAFNFDPTIFDASSISVNFDPNNWMTLNSPVLSLDKQPYLGRLDVGYTRTNGYAVSGYGKIATVDIVIEDDIYGIRADEEAIKKGYIDIARYVEITNFGTIGGSGNFYYGDDKQTDFIVRFNLDNNKNTDNENILLSPNPADEYVNIHLNGGNEIKSLNVYNLAGQLVEQISLTGGKKSSQERANSVRLDISKYDNGIYVVKALTDFNSFTKKFVKTK